MGSTLLQFVHPALEKSRVNRKLLQKARSLEGVTVNDLYERYPDLCVDAKQEQALMEAHPSVVFQFPMYWYSSPALLKEWLDIVLEYGWAYGRTGRALVDKRVRIAVTTGGSKESYTRAGHNRYTMEELLRPLTCTLELCGMRKGDPFFIHNALHLKDEELEQAIDGYANWLKVD